MLAADAGRIPVNPISNARVAMIVSLLRERDVPRAGSVGNPFIYEELALEQSPICVRIALSYVHTVHVRLYRPGSRP